MLALPLTFFFTASLSASMLLPYSFRGTGFYCFPRFIGSSDASIASDIAGTPDTGKRETA